MSLKYHLVQKKDMRKNAGANAKLFYGQVRTQSLMTFDKLCSKVSAFSTATKGDVQLIISGLISVLSEYLEMGHAVQVGELGRFRLSAGSSGTEKEEDFNTSLFKKGRILFTPGTALRDMEKKVSFEKMVALEVEKECTRDHID